MRQILDTYAKHRGNPGDGLNISEAAGAGADLFITGDRAVETLFGTSAGGGFNIPFSEGTSIGIERVIQP